MIMSNILFSDFTEKMDGVVNSALESIPTGIETVVGFLPVMKLVILLIAVFLAVGILIRLIIGSGSGINRAISCAFGILFLYAFSITVYSLNPMGFSKFLSPLPFVSFHGKYLKIMSITDTDFPVICTHFLSAFFLAFIVNSLDSIFPKGKSILSWYVMRLFCVIAGIFLNLALIWAEQKYIPGLLGEYAPIALLGILLIFLLIGISKVFLGLILSAVNPFIGVVYAFFFGSFLGKQIIKSLMTALLIALFFYFVQSRGYTIISIEPSNLLSCIPLTGAMLLIWYFLGHAL